MSEIIVRTALPQDAAGIATVHVRTWQSAYKEQIPDAYLSSMSVEKSTDRWKTQLENPQPNSYPLVAERDHQILGWCTAGKSRDEDADAETGEIYGIYVLPDYHGHGVGSKLIEKGLDLLKKDGYKKATLWVLDTNRQTRHWYEHKGWRIEGKTKVEHHSGGFDLNEVRYIINLN